MQVNNLSSCWRPNTWPAFATELHGRLWHCQGHQDIKRAQGTTTLNTRATKPLQAPDDCMMHAPKLQHCRGDWHCTFFNPKGSHSALRFAAPQGPTKWHTKAVPSHNRALLGACPLPCEPWQLACQPVGQCASCSTAASKRQLRPQLPAQLVRGPDKTCNKNVYD